MQGNAGSIYDRAVNRLSMKIQVAHLTERSLGI